MITQVDYISIGVTDQDRAKAFYADVLGFEVLADRPMPSPGGDDDEDDGRRWIEMRPPGAATRIVLLLDLDRPRGLGPCVFDTDDIVKTAESIRAAGGAIVEEPVRSADGAWWARFGDSEGNEFGLNQRSLEGS